VSALTLPHNFAVFMDGPACGRVRKVLGRPRLVQGPDSNGNLIVYEYRRGYADHGLAVLFYTEVKRDRLRHRNERVAA
jgi:hypothetical protein